MTTDFSSKVISYLNIPKSVLQFNSILTYYQLEWTYVNDSRLLTELSGIFLQRHPSKQTKEPVTPQLTEIQLHKKIKCAFIK